VSRRWLPVEVKDPADGAHDGVVRGCS